MITRTQPQCQTENSDLTPLIPLSAGDSAWQPLLSAAAIPLEQLLGRLGLTVSDYHRVDGAIDTAPLSFPVRVPEPFIARMERGNINDPLLRQVLPLQAENHLAPGYIADPLEEADANVVPGLIHKYHGRALLIATRACAIHCRYCFRRHFAYQDNQPDRREWQQAFEYLTENTAIREVIFSGGDPLACSNARLNWFGQQLAAIPHISRLRIHSRLPVVLPQRVDQPLLQWLSSWDGQKVMVIHCNHARELDQSVADAIGRLKDIGVTVLNQTVLLKGVNDSPDALVELSERLYDCGAMPYYLHLLDPVQGAAHFAVSDARAQRLVGAASERLPGYLLPKLVRESAGQNSKTPLALIQ